MFDDADGVVERGRVATALLEGFFARWMDYGFTARMEADLAHRRRYAGVPEGVAPEALTLEQPVALLER